MLYWTTCYWTTVNARFRAKPLIIKLKIYFWKCWFNVQKQWDMRIMLPIVFQYLKYVVTNLKSVFQISRKFKFLVWYTGHLRKTKITIHGGVKFLSCIRVISWYFDLMWTQRKLSNFISSSLTKMASQPKTSKC